MLKAELRTTQLIQVSLGLKHPNLKEVAVRLLSVQGWAPLPPRLRTATVPKRPLDDGGADMAHKPGLYANINAKRARIKAGSNERMRKPGAAGAPSKKDFVASAKTAGKKK